MYLCYNYHIHINKIYKLNIVWFKRDLRLHDHASLSESVKNDKVLLLYIVEPDLWRLPDSSFRHWSFIYDSLIDLSKQIRGLNAELCIRVGEAINVFENIKNTVSHFTLYSHEETGNAWTYTRDRAVMSWCKSHDIIWKEFPSNGVVRRLKSRNEWSGIRETRMKQDIIPVPSVISAVTNVSSDKLPAKDHPMFNHKSGFVQLGGRGEAIKLLRSFLQYRCKDYMSFISKPEMSAQYCSRLSPHIAFGTISVREIEQAVREKISALSNFPTPDNMSFVKQLQAYLSRLAWHCHFIQKFEQQSDIEFKCTHPSFEGIRENDFIEERLEAWKTGNTGYPFIDACMRSLHAKGWINFRMRAMLVSFASYHLWLDWRQTAPFLATLFTDYEPGIHYSQFQMQSGVTGINSIRIYSPIKQSYDQDPYGKFIKHYVPELENVPSEYIHEPWKMLLPLSHYPKRMIVHEEALAHAHKKFKIIFDSEHFAEKSKEIMEKLGSRKNMLRPTRRRNKNSKPRVEQLEINL